MTDLIKCAECGQSHSAEPIPDADELVDPCPNCGRERTESDESDELRDACRHQSIATYDED